MIYGLTCLFLKIAKHKYKMTILCVKILSAKKAKKPATIMGGIAIRLYIHTVKLHMTAVEEIWASWYPAPHGLLSPFTVSQKSLPTKKSNCTSGNELRHTSSDRTFQSVTAVSVLYTNIDRYCRVGLELPMQVRLKYGRNVVNTEKGRGPEAPSVMTLQSRGWQDGEQDKSNYVVACW